MTVLKKDPGPFRTSLLNHFLSNGPLSLSQRDGLELLGSESLVRGKLEESSRWVRPRREDKDEGG